MNPHDPSPSYLAGYHAGFRGDPCRPPLTGTAHEHYVSGYEVGTTERMAYEARQRSRWASSEAMFLPTTTEQE